MFCSIFGSCYYSSLKHDLLLLELKSLLMHDCIIVYMPGSSFRPFADNESPFLAWLGLVVRQKEISIVYILIHTLPVVIIII